MDPSDFGASPQALLCAQAAEPALAGSSGMPGNHQDIFVLGAYHKAPFIDISYKICICIYYNWIFLHMYTWMFESAGTDIST